MFICLPCAEAYDSDVCLCGEAELRADALRDDGVTIWYPDEDDEAMPARAEAVAW